MHEIDYRSVKKELRQQILARRSALTSEEVAARSKVITDYLDTMEPLASAQVIMGYAPFRNEVDIMPWLISKLKAGVKVLLPRISAVSGEIEAVPMELDETMGTSKLGVREPRGLAVDTAVIEAVIVPGVVFDRQGYRLGYGKGYYDRFLPRLGLQVFHTAVAFELQMVDQVPHEAHDFRLHRLVTEQGIYTWRG